MRSLSISIRVSIQDLPDVLALAPGYNSIAAAVNAYIRAQAARSRGGVAAPSLPDAIERIRALGYDHPRLGEAKALAAMGYTSPTISAHDMLNAIAPVEDDEDESALDDELFGDLG